MSEDGTDPHYRQGTPSPSGWSPYRTYPSLGGSLPHVSVHTGVLTDLVEGGLDSHGTGFTL